MYNKGIMKYCKDKEYFWISIGVIIGSIGGSLITNMLYKFVG